MARLNVIVSDLSGERIADSELATVLIRPRDGRKGNVELDVALPEVKDLMAKGRQVARRGRKPKTNGA